MRPHLLYLLFICYLVDSYKILIYSGPYGHSHTIFMARIADVLQQGGHDVVVYALPEMIMKDLQPWQSRIWSTNSRSIIGQLQLLAAHTELMLRSCDSLLGDNGTMQMLADEHFDAGITEMIDSCGFGIFSYGLHSTLPCHNYVNLVNPTARCQISWAINPAKKIGIDHMIAATALGMMDTIAEYFDVPKLPSVFPSFLLPYTNRMYFVERTINLIASIFADICSSDFGRRYKEVWSRHGAAADEEYYKRRTNYLLSNTDEFLEFGRPSSPKIVHIGGIALPEAAPLSEKLQQIVDHVNMGVVYISFGSVAPTNEVKLCRNTDDGMPKYFREAIIEVAKVFSNYDFIWKVDEGDAVQNISNLHTFSWVTQAALIAHPRLRCFVSHGGLNSVLEVTRSGKPSIMVPIYGDQMRNARLVEVKNTTIVIAKEDFNRVTFAAALEQVLSDKSYSQRAERLASLMVNKPFPVRDRLLSTVEFSIRHGRISDLDIGTHLNTLQYYSIDVMIFLIIFFSFVATTFMYVLRYLFRKTVKVKVKKD